MKGFFARLQKTMLVISAALVVVSTTYSAVRFYAARKSVNTVQAELEATKLKISEYGKEIGRSLPPAKNGKPAFDPSKFLYDQEVDYSSCLSITIEGVWAGSDCDKVLNRDRHTGPRVNFAIPDIRNALAEAKLGLFFSAIGLLLAALTLFLSWLVTGRTRV